MILQKHKEYKDSGVEWLGEIPKHWNCKRNKNVFYEASEKSQNGKGDLLTVSHITGVTLRSEKNVNMFMAENFEGYKICKKEDLIINTMWAWMGALGTTKIKGICSPAYNVYRKNRGVDFDHRYFDKLFRTPSFIVEINRNSKGIVSSRLRLYPKEFFNIHTIIPPKFEQTQIATYLDQKTWAIDKKIALLQQKAVYYKEYRKILINDLVTGKSIIENNTLIKLTPTKTKESSIGTVGRIPNHWEVKRIKDIAKIFTGNSISDKSIFENKENAIPYVSTKDLNIDNKTVNYDNGIYIPKNNTDFKVAKPNSSLLCLEGASAGKKITFVNRKVAFVNKLCALKTFDESFEDKYLFYFLQSSVFNNQFFAILSGLIGGVSLSLLKYFDVLKPNRKEQNTIADFLDVKTATIDKIIKSINQQTATLQELRKTLINEMVTGQVKVPT